MSEKKIDPKRPRQSRRRSRVRRVFRQHDRRVVRGRSALSSCSASVTGYGGTTKRVEQYSDRILDREITVRFDAKFQAAWPGSSGPSSAASR